MSLTSSLQVHFGFDSFRAGQAEAIQSLLNNHPTLVGNACGLSGQVLYSGGAKGVDTLSMEAALEARGTAVGVLADSLTRAVKSQKEALSRGDLCLVTPHSPSAGFSVGAAMGRNRDPQK